VLCAPSRPARRSALIGLAITGLVFLVELLAAWRYFGTPFPLPFYVKARNIYGPFFAEQYRGIPMTEVLNYLSSYGLLWVLGILGLALGRKASGWRAYPLQKTLSGITILFVCYHTFFVLQIMHQDQRLYHPTLPALVCLGVWGVSQLIGHLPSDLKDACRTHQDKLVLVFVFLLSWTLIPKAIQAVWFIKERVKDKSFANYNLLEDAQKNGSITWFCLDKFSMLPNDLVIATTDVGLPCALNLNKTIVDLAGLNEKTFALKDFSADTLFQKYAPDVLYLPHPHYLEMRDAIGNHPVFRERYEFYPEAILYRTRNGLGIRKDSPYYPALQKMVRDSMPDWLSWGVDRSHPPTP
jgi:hypothetical protein